MKGNKEPDPIQNMEYLYQVNPKLKEFQNVVIYGIGEFQKKVFYSLIQQDISINAFCTYQEISLSRLFGKKIITEEELCQRYYDACVIVAGASIENDLDRLKKIGIKNIMVEINSANDSEIFYVDED